MLIYVWKYQPNAFVRDTVIDSGTSTIWHKCYNDAGDFELYVRATPEYMDLFHNNFVLLTRPGHKEAMIPDHIQLTTDAELGDYLIISGRSAESLLGNRIFTQQWNYSNWYAESMIRDMITRNVIAPDDLTRKIPQIVLGTNHGWYVKTDKQVAGKNLLTTISDVCKAQGWGFELQWDGSLFTFELYEGANRSSGELPHVVFSPEYGNLGNTDYTRDMSTYYNSIYVAGEGEGSDRVIVNEKTGRTGLFLRELWVDAMTTSATTSGGTLTPQEYRTLLVGEAKEEVQLHKDTITYNGEVFDTEVYKYGVDYFLGDKVTVINGYGIKGTAVVSDITEVEDSTGYRIYPTLTEWSVD
jgi:hypothetical protein